MVLLPTRVRNMDKLILFENNVSGTTFDMDCPRIIFSNVRLVLKKSVAICLETR